ncbi:uncharacterized protein LOC130744934 [Lotus japonicus]|uniref:uncharacterized protein LOC130744934 n=1 Tax=Lotus japonicus TaxID=34305 RepID=UPI00258A8060|nr:uncharacterized protein LOC130744934 [Lotus japonicus]
MGCCFSKATTQNPQNQNPQKNQHQPHHVRSSLPKSNPTHEEEEEEEEPSPPLEEETVKEVLSETPISKPHQVPILTPESKTQLVLLQHPDPVLMETKTQMPLLQNPPEKFEIETKDVIEEVSEVVSSQITEACSISESFSAATTATTATVTEKREDEATSKQQSVREGTATQKWSRSPSRKRPHAADGRERRVKSPARRPEPSPSPEKRVKSGSRLVRGRESGPLANRKLNASPARVRRDAGEGSGRRSRSPSCVRKVGGGATRKVDAGADRKVVPPATTNAVEKEKSENETEEVGEKNDVVQQGESLENPHVSMECFIFL